MPISPEDARAIAKEATIYGFPLVDSYRIQHSYFVERVGGSEEECMGLSRLTTRASKSRVFFDSDPAGSVGHLKRRAILRPRFAVIVEPGGRDV